MRNNLDFMEANFISNVTSSPVVLNAVSDLTEPSGISLASIWL